MTRISIRWKLTLWYGAALCVILAIFSAATYWRYRAAAWTAFDADLAMNLDTLQAALIEEIHDAQAASPADVRQPDGSSGSSLQSLRRAAKQTLEDFRLNGLYAEIRQGLGAETVLARLPGVQVGQRGAVLPESAWKDAAGSRATRIIRLGSNVRSAIRSVQPSPELDPIELAVADRTTLVDGTLAAIRRSLIQFGTVGLILALGGGYWLATRALSPIDAMTTQADRMAETPSSGPQRLQVRNPGDELGRLSLTFNRLLERIAVSMNQLRAFIADAAHELKTPVSVIRGEAELSLSAERSLEEYRDALRAIAHESQRLSLIVSDLTLLAEGETLDHPLERRRIDLKEMVHEVARSLRTLAAGRSVVVEIESSKCGDYRGDERLLRQVVTNLLENAIKFSPSPGRVAVVLAQEGENIEIRILDQAPTLSPKDRERVFERFYRARESAGSETRGSGLGLAIVRWAVTLHGGRIRVEPREAAGNEFVVTLPLAPEPAETRGDLSGQRPEA